MKIEFYSEDRQTCIAKANSPVVPRVGEVVTLYGNKVYSERRIEVLSVEYEILNILEFTTLPNAVPVASVFCKIESEELI